jgi:mannose-6-phosphate isomerase-like protein (cupin superfamily)
MAKVSYEIGDHDTRPWGTWQVIDVGDRFVVKRITVLPGKRLSYQYHKHRMEHWVVVQGQATITLDDRKVPLDQDEHIHIPVGAKHRIENKTDEEVVFIEVQSGDQLDEEDIIRIEDDFGRA